MKEPFSAEQWTSLKEAPLVVFFLVANADGTVDSEEVEKLIGLFRKPEDYGSQLFAQIIAEIMADAGALEQSIAGILGSAKNDFSAHLTQVRAMVDSTLDATEGGLFKNALLTLGIDIARASGDEGNPVSLEERAELATLRTLLQI